MKILLVEDQSKVASFIIRGLKEEAYSVDYCSNGKEANSNMSLYEYDVILLDLMLPDSSGVELCRKWRKQGLLTPVIMLTARSDVDSRINGLDAGANDYLCKPFDFGELLARIRVQLRQDLAQNATVLTVYDLKMDLYKREVYRAEKKIDLTVKEFNLLEYLLRNKGRVVSRTAIIEHVWDMHFDSDTNIVDVFIRYLRKKIDEGFDEKIIETCRGRGYTIA
ncbi:MAG: response regulator transcription factor [Lentisphaerales bacterium]|nr:response regulator transcription factor [Lentisphaerales bacterium]